MTASLSPQLIEAARQASSRRVAIEVLPETGSTNADLLKRINSLAQPTLLLALSQTSGRGRNGRAWHSAQGASLTFSLAWKFALAQHEVVGLPLAVGVAIAQTLGKFGVRVQLKWPNDIMKGGKKLAGVLIETPHAEQATNETWVVIGVGMNLTLPDSLEEKIGQPAADMPWLAQIDKNILMAALLDELSNALALYDRDKLSPFVPLWNQLHAFAGQEVIIIDRRRSVLHGLAAGIDSSGRLLVDSAAGITAVSAGDVSLRTVKELEYAAAD